MSYQCGQTDQKFLKKTNKTLKTHFTLLFKKEMQ